jgi:hypothetical protein
MSRTKNPQTFKKAEPTEDQSTDTTTTKVAYFCKPGNEVGQPGGCDPGYKCIDTGLPMGTCEKIVKAPPDDA